MKSYNKSFSWLQISAVRVTRIHFLLIIAYILQIIVFDSWNLIQHEAVAQRWMLVALLATLNTVLWYLARLKVNNPIYYLVNILLLAIADIILAGLMVYWERGMASTSVILFTISLVTVASLYSRSALLATASLCAVTYSSAAVIYFNQNYGEGFRVQLYGQVGFYCILFFVIALLLMVVAGIPKNSS